MEYSLSIRSIYGVNVGAEFMPHETVIHMDKDALWGLMLDLFCIRLMYIQF